LIYNQNTAYYVTFSYREAWRLTLNNSYLLAARGLEKMNSIDEIRSRDDLIDYLNRGHRIKCIYFWSHRLKNSASVGKHCLSQWFPSPFALDNVIYYTAEHYMMAGKALLFNDIKAFEDISLTQDPGKAKHLGRTIKNFSEELWEKKRFDIVVSGNFAKFSQNPKLSEFLINSRNRILVEASPRDRIWGIGLTEDDPKANNPNLWNGLNLLGFALMKVRYQLKKVDTVYS